MEFSLSIDDFTRMVLVKDTPSRFPHTKVAVSSDGKSGELWRVSDKSILVSGGGNAGDVLVISIADQVCLLLPQAENVLTYCYLESRTNPG